MNTDFLAIPEWFSYENAGAGMAVADLNADGFPDLVVLQVDDPAGVSSAYFRVGFGTNDQLTIGQWTAWSPVPDWDSWFNEGAGVAIADISGNGQPDLLVFRVDAVPNGQNAGYYRIGWDIDAAGQVTGWSPWLAVPDWFPWFNAGADVTVADVDGDGVLDLVVLMVDSPAGRNQGYYRSGPLNADGTVTAWRPWVAVPDWYFWENQGAGIAVADLDGDGIPELVESAADVGDHQSIGHEPQRTQAEIEVPWRWGDEGRRGHTFLACLAGSPEAASQVCGQGLVGQPLDDRGEGVRARLVVGEHAARLPIGRNEQEPAYRFDRIERERPLDGLLQMPAGHRSHVADQHRPTVRVSDLAVELRKVGEHGGVEVEQTFGNGKRRSGRGEALAQ